jgi:hypothetical protein
VASRVREKIAQIVAQPMFCQMFCITFFRGKSCPKHPPKNRPIGENSPNLVTLALRDANFFFSFR